MLVNVRRTLQGVNQEILSLRLCGGLAYLVAAITVVAIWQTRALSQQRKSAPSPLKVLMQAPVDRAVDFPLNELERSYREMDAQGIATLRLLEGGKYNVNIRRISEAEEPLVHAKTTEVYVVTEGSGILVTGGQVVDAESRAARRWRLSALTLSSSLPAYLTACGRRAGSRG